jgi:iron complex outermembrane recepter protein
MRRLCFLISVAAMIGIVYSIPASAESDVEPASAGLEEIVVTARRKEENAQVVPVSVNLFSADRLGNASVETLNDVSELAPGLHIADVGGLSSVSMRGIAKMPVGNTVPGVVVYFDEATLPNSGINIPVYDLDNVQVFRGPQGTLFGRNALGGAVMLTSKAPTYDWDGYLKATYGNYNYRTIEGAQNIPLIQDVLTVRVAANFRYRDGLQSAVPSTLTTTFGAPYNQSYTQSTPAGGALDNIDQRSGRATILFQPIDHLSNTTVLDFFKADEMVDAPTAFASNPTFLPSVFGPSLGPVLTAGYNAGVQDAVSAQLARGPWAIPRVPGVDYGSYRESFAVINTTRFDAGDNLHIKNILSYRLASQQFAFSTDGVPLIPGPLGTFIIYKPDGLRDDRRMYSEELQFQGSAFSDILTYTAGATGLWDVPRGGGGTYEQSFVFAPIAIPVFTTQDLGTRNQGVYAQLGIDLSKWTIQGLKLTLGARNSWDQAFGCGAQTVGGWDTLAECREHSTEVSLGDSNRRSYTVGLDWKINDGLFVYATTRHSYRGVNVNPPLFTSPYTTGAPGLCLGGQNCPDLRPYQGTQPDEVTDYEVGIKTDWRVFNMPGRFNIAAYDSNYKNLVEFVNYQTVIPSTAPDFPESGSLGINVANLRIQGFEIESSIMPLPGLTLSLNGAYTNQVVEKILIPVPLLEGAGITQPSPKWSGTLSAQYVAPVHPFGADLIADADDFYTGETREELGFPISGYNLLNARVGLNNIADRHVDVGLWLRNALDRAYIDAPTVVLSSFPLKTGTYGDPRTYGIDVSYKW